ncbi:MAG TPA: Xaa-Pro peptidase family protein [Gemmatimonadaceae bacterium]|nr:Xaa-Pro peptidase family protein [Gemmatimonadaceae bacterium]
MLSPTTLPALQLALADLALDGWLLFDFHGLNPVAIGLAGVKGMATRRWFVLVPREGEPVALTHNIEQGIWRDWPAGWPRERYSTWRTLEELLATHVRGKRVAMEYSPGDAVPYLDRIPAGVLEMVRAAGAEVVSSGELVTRFYAVLGDPQLASHERAARVVAETARAAMTLAGERARAGAPIAEHELMAWILDRFARAGLETDGHGPNVSAGANAANPHYEPSAEHPRPINMGDVLLIDLWAREPEGVFADQTWMGVLGDPSSRVVQVWEAVRDARDAALALIRDRVARGEPVRGGEVDDAARAVVVQRGLGEYFTHRTGHSIDARDLHGSGPHIDNFETREERVLVPGVAFSIEPGVYIPGDVGMRSEVNVYLTPGRAVVTPAEYQRELLVV